MRWLDTKTNKTSMSMMITPLLDREKTKVWHDITDVVVNRVDLDLKDEQVIEKLNFDFVDYSDWLDHCKEENSQFIHSTNEIINQLDQLLTIHDHVITQTLDFQKESNSLITQLSKLDNLYTDLSTKLSNFTNIDSIITRLNTVNNSKIVLKLSFHENITKLDQSINFLNDNKNKDFKDIKIYKFRFKQCMIKSLTLIRNYIINYIKNLESKIIADVTPNIVEPLIYNEWIISLNDIHPLFMEIFNRIDNDTDYFNLLDDIYNQYFKSRLNLLNKYIIKPFDLSLPLIDFANNNLNFYLKLINKEYNIFIQFTSDSQLNIDILNNFFQNDLLDSLYYSIRNKILHESSINSLCDLINLINSFENPLFNQILHDVQTRLIFKINKFIELNIKNYKSTLTPTDIYPPILKSIQLINKIHSLLNQSIFDDLISIIVHHILISINKLNDANAVDNILFKLKSLLKLQKFLNNYDIKYSRRQTVINIKNYFPHIENNFINYKVELQNNINNQFKKFINNSCKILLINLSTDSLSINDWNNQLIENLSTELPRLELLINQFLGSGEVNNYLIDCLNKEFMEQINLILQNKTKQPTDKQDIELLDTQQINKKWSNIIVDLIKKEYLEQNIDQDNDYLEILNIQNDGDVKDDDDNVSDIVDSSVTNN